MLKIILPVSLITFLIEFFGWLQQLDGWLAPLMGTIHLPAAAALPLVAGMLTGIYGGIAAMSVQSLNVDQMTMIAVFLLIAHSLIHEGVVQHRSGCPAWMATVVRLSAAVLTVYVVGLFLGADTALITEGEATVSASMAFWPALKGWGAAMLRLNLKILLIITALMIFMEVLKQYSLIDRVMRFIAPFLGLLGLDRQVGVLWMTAVVFGITYGGAVIVAETKERLLTPQQLKRLHVSIGINHAMIEDPLLFMPLGIHPFWLWFPRLIAAVVFTHAFRLWQWFKSGRRPAAAAVAHVDDHGNPGVISPNVNQIV